ncbi:GCD1 Nucleoside-diphosphate-sugar pyrophosphorylase involved in lipopolysaccharide biosynthesis/translation initiation factor 2B, gamma/epsilon subunits (eIF-2Bgamma/eIF-2Bepsilon) [actinobacterium SCGC AAA044-D11]
MHSKERSAILLVGGRGTRLAPLTNNTPKPMLQVAGVPFTEHQILKARDAGITEIVLATSFKAELFEPYFGDGKNFGIAIKYAVEEVALGTGGAISNAAQMLTGSGPVAIFYGDVLSQHDLDGQFNFHKLNGADVTLYLTKVEDARAFGAVELDDSGRVSAFNEKMENPPTNIINAGCYIFERSVIDTIPFGKVVSVERETFPSLLANGAKVFGFIDTSYWLDIGTPAALLKASRDLVFASSKDFLALPDSNIAATAKITGGSVIGRSATIAEMAIIQGSLIGDGASIGERARLINCFVAAGFSVPSDVIAENNFFGF